jgi:muconolactone delta-isomerase
MAMSDERSDSMTDTGMSTEPLNVAPVRVNLIAPGFVNSGLSAAVLGDGLDARRAQLRASLPIAGHRAHPARLAVHIMVNTALTGARSTSPVAGNTWSKEQIVEFLVEFEVTVPDGTPQDVIDERNRAEASAAAGLAREGHLVRHWGEPVAPGERRTVGLYRADNDAQLDALLGRLPLHEWMHLTVTPLSPHPNDPEAVNEAALPRPRLIRVYRLDASVGKPLELGETAQGRRRIVPLTAGSFDSAVLGPGTLVAGVSADWQTVLADGTALGDIRYTLRTKAGHVLDVRSRSLRHGSPDVLARLADGEPVDPREYTFRAATQIETAEPSLEWVNKGVFVSVGARDVGGVTYETYLVS